MVFTLFQMDFLLSSYAVSTALDEQLAKENIRGDAMTSNQIAYMQAKELARHNIVGEAETRRSNLANEEIGRRNAESAERSSWASERSSKASLLKGISGTLF